MTRAFVEARGLRLVYAGGTEALRGIDLDIEEGSFVAAIGLSGAGKSSFLRCLNHLVRPTSGSITVGGRQLVGAPGAELRRVRRETGMVFQQFNLVRRMSVLGNVLVGRLGYHQGLGALWPRFTDLDRAVSRAALARVGLADRERSRADRLSGGQQQRVAIARALAQQPRLMLADEPVASLDPETSLTVLSHLREINQRDGITTIAALHQLDLAEQFADRVVAFRDGRIVYDGAPNAVSKEVYGRIYRSDER
ncbi:MAG: phosphonate ABC transporter ATP-binding protein [Candidatus Limnocylindrales bacterium]